uniref:Bm1220 n=1 Tax=Brugia malayi TaxID=6279 RepID=A0A1I9G0U4_BRUMA|nr:Bm1220 [Brugia malayi]
MTLLSWKIIILFSDSNAKIFNIKVILKINNIMNRLSISHFLLSHFLMRFLFILI